jgi:hypothetical protein
MLIKSSYDKLYRNNGRRDPVSWDNSNKQIFLFRVFRGNKQIDYRQARQLSNLLVCWQGRKSAYYPPVTIYIYQNVGEIHMFIHFLGKIVVFPGWILSAPTWRRRPEMSGCPEKSAAWYAHIWITMLGNEHTWMLKTKNPQDGLCFLTQA